MLMMSVLGLGITAGAHRLWSHRTYKARLPLRLVLMLANTMAGENSIYTWTRDHRTHHKFSETHGDPHNAKVRMEMPTCLSQQSSIYPWPCFLFAFHRGDSSSRTWAGFV